MIKVEITKQMEMVLYHSEQSDVTVNAIIKDETIEKVVVAKITTTTQFAFGQRIITNA